MVALSNAHNVIRCTRLYALPADCADFSGPNHTRPATHLEMTKKRILIGELEQETATFNPSPTELAMFRVSAGSALLGEYAGTRTQLGAALDLLGSRGDVEIVPTYAASSVSGGPIPTEDLDHLIDALTGALANAAAAGPVGKFTSTHPRCGPCDLRVYFDRMFLFTDGVYLSLHGAMAGVTDNDPEGR